MTVVLQVLQYYKPTEKSVWIVFYKELLRINDYLKKNF